MFINALEDIFKREQKIPDEYLRIVETEYRSVPLDYIEYFFEQNNRLPSAEELQYAI
jgi:hypothetical protein